MADPGSGATTDPQLVDLALKVLESITDEKLRGMDATGLTISADDWARFHLSDKGPQQRLWGLPVERSGLLSTGCFILTSVGAG
jgi:hypothetical protein